MPVGAAHLGELFFTLDFGFNLPYVGRPIAIVFSGAVKGTSGPIPKFLEFPGSSRESLLKMLVLGQIPK